MTLTVLSVLNTNVEGYVLFFFLILSLATIQGFSTFWYGCEIMCKIAPYQKFDPWWTSFFAKLTSLKHKSLKSERHWFWHYIQVHLITKIWWSNRRRLNRAPDGEKLPNFPIYFFKYFSDRASSCNSGRQPTWRTISSMIRLFESSTCFEQLCAHPQEDNYMNTTSGIIPLC